MEWISHRGLNLLHCENTLQAFDAAIDAGCKILETDLRLTADGQIVLCHDKSFQRLGGPQTQVHEMTTSQISTVMLTHHTNSFSARPLMLSDFIERYSQQQWVFDIKSETAIDVLKTLRKMQDEKHLNFSQQTYFLLWQPEHETFAKACFPEARLFANDKQCKRAGFCHLLGLRSLANIHHHYCYALPPTFAGLDLFKPKIIDRYHAQYAKVIAYLPKTPQQVELAKMAGCDFVICDWDPNESAWPVTTQQNLGRPS